MKTASFEVLRAGPGDVTLARQAVAEVHGRTTAVTTTVRSFLRDRSCYLILAVENRHVLGSLNGYLLRRPHDGRPQFLLYEIDVRPEYRRKGVGHALMTAVTSEARSARASEVWVISNESNRAALALYRKSGFLRHHRDDVVLILVVEAHSVRRRKAL